MNQRLVPVVAVALLLVVAGCGTVPRLGADPGSTPQAAVTGTAAAPGTNVDPPSALPARVPSSPVEGPTLQPDGQLPAARPSPVSFDAPLGFALHVPVLTYHLVATPREAGSALPGLVVPPALFDAQLTRLQAAGWHTITLAALASDLAAGRRPAPRTFVITIDDGRVDGYSEALPILRRHAMVATYFVIAGRIGRPGYLDAGEVRALAAVGMEIGDHSMDHVNLVRATPAELQIEVAGAAEILARITGTAPVSFAYPFGDFDAAVARAVASAGLWMAVTTRAGTLETADVRYEVPRLHVGPGTLPEDLLKRLVDQTW